MDYPGAARMRSSFDGYNQILSYDLQDYSFLFYSGSASWERVLFSGDALIT